MFKTRDFLRFFRSVITGIDYGNITVIVSELDFSVGKGTNTASQVLYAFNLCKIRVLFAIVDSIQLDIKVVKNLIEMLINDIEI